MQVIKTIVNIYRCDFNERSDRMNENFAMIILLIALGYILKKLKFFKASDGNVLATLVLNVTLPSLVIVNLNGTNLDLSLGWLPILMLLYGVIAKVFIIWLFKKNYNNQVRGTVGMMAASVNIGLFAYPLVSKIWPETGLLYFGMIDIGTAIIMFGVTYFVGSYFNEAGDQFDFKKMGLKLITTVPLMTYMIMFILNIMSIKIPGKAIDFFDIISQANLPLSMILLGLFLNFKIEKAYLPIVIKYLLFHYGFGLFMGLLVYFFLPVDDPMIKTSLLLAWLLPVGVSVLSYAITFKYKTLPIIGMTTNISIVISIVILYLFQLFFV